MSRWLFLFLALLLPLPVVAQDNADALEGSWALQIGPATIFRFDMEPVEGKAGEWRGTWSKPRSFASDGDHFSQLTLPAREVPSMAGLDLDGEVELSFDDPRPGAIPDIFRFRLIDADAVEMIYVGTGLAPYTLYRVGQAAPLGPFEAGVIYDRTLAKAPEIKLEPDSAPKIAPKPVLDDEPDSFRLAPSATPTR